MQKTTKSLMVGMLFGAIAGAIAGILFAPKSGKETRADIGRYLNEIKDKIADDLSKIGEFTKENYRAVADRVVNVYEAAKKISPEDAEEIKADLNKNYDQVKKAAKKIRKDFDDEE